MIGRFTSLWIGLLFLATGDAAAATVTHQIDFLVIGDDETVTVSFENNSPPGEPMELWFDGFAENLETVGNNGFFANLQADGARVADQLRYETPPVDLVNGAVQVPVHLHAMLEDSPSQVGLLVERLGPSDNIHVNGTLMLTNQVPEPTGWLVATITMMALLDHGRKHDISP